MRLLRHLTVATLSLLVARLLAVPEVLVVQSKSIKLSTESASLSDRNAKAAKANLPKGEGGSALFDVSEEFAQELYNGGRVSPIVWSMTDPIFRSAVYEGIIKSPPEQPTLQQAQAVQKKLKVELLLLIEANLVGDHIEAVAALYKGDKVVWRDQKSMGTLVGGKFDREGAARSLARTWSEVLAQSALKGFVPSPVRQTPDPEAGSVPKSPDVQPTPVLVGPADNKKLFDEADGLLSTGDSAKAISLLRDSIDAKPDDLERRKKLVQVLMKAHKPELAALEARKAGTSSAIGLELRMMAAKAWLEAGKPDEAQTDLNEIVTRDPKGSEARELLGEAALWQLKAAVACDHFSAAIKDKPSAEAFLYRALGRAIEGDSESATADVESAKSKDPTPLNVHYGFCMLVLDKVSTQALDEIRALFQGAALKPGKEVADGVTYQTRRLTGLLAVIQAPNAPKAHSKSQERRVLALKLLVQALSDLGGYLENPTDEALADARITLGEATKQISAAQQAYLAESKETA